MFIEIKVQEIISLKVLIEVLDTIKYKFIMYKYLIEFIKVIEKFQNYHKANLFLYIHIIYKSNKKDRMKINSIFCTYPFTSHKMHESDKLRVSFNMYMNVQEGIL